MNFHRSLILHGYKPFDLRYHQSNVDGENGDGTGTAGKIVFNTQDDLDRLIQKRLDRQKDALGKDEEFIKGIRDAIKSEQDAEALKEQGQFEEMYNAEVTKNGALQTKIDELKDQIAQTEKETLRKTIAAKHKIPDELADRLKGDTEEEIIADAKALAKSLKVKEESEEEDDNKEVGPPSRRKHAETDAGKKSPLRPVNENKPDGENNNGKPTGNYAFVKEGDVSWGSGGD